MSRRRRRQFRRGIFLLPSLFTTGSLFCGYYSLIATLHGDYRAAALTIGIALVLDGLDGRIARMTDSQTEFGSAYDSLADVVAFGLAPAVLVFSWGLWDLGRAGWLFSFFYATCAATRLARFNVDSSADRRYFIGLPTPLASCQIAALAFYWPARVESLLLAKVLLALVALLSVLMVSKLRYRSFKDIDLRERQPSMLVLLVAMAIALIALDPENVLLLAATLYTLSGLVARLAVLVTRGERPSAGSSDAATTALKPSPSSSTDDPPT